jgi:hypothetical protein
MTSYNCASPVQRPQPSQFLVSGRPRRAFSAYGRSHEEIGPDYQVSGPVPIPPIIESSITTVEAAVLSPACSCPLLSSNRPSFQPRTGSQSQDLRSSSFPTVSHRLHCSDGSPRHLEFSSLYPHVPPAILRTRRGNAKTVAVLWCGNGTLNLGDQL